MRYQRQRIAQIYRIFAGGDQMDVGLRSSLPDERRRHRNISGSQHISQNTIGKKNTQLRQSVYYLQ